MSTVDAFKLPAVAQRRLAQLAPAPSLLISSAELSAVADRLAAEDDSPFAVAFRAEMARPS